VSFGLPNRNGINAAFLTMAIGAGMTSAITNPMHEEVIRAIMGADVMMGHDPDCARWIRRFREAPAMTPNATGEMPRGRREGDTAAGLHDSPRPLSIHAVGKRGSFRWAPQCCRQAAAWVSTLIRSAADAACAAVARYWFPRASSPSTA